MDWRARALGTDQLHVGTHLSDLTHLYHDKLVYFWIFLLIVPHLGLLVRGKGKGRDRKSRLCGLEFGLKISKI